MLSDVMEDYLKTVYMLQEEEEGPASTSSIAERLDVKPPTVTSMLDKLEERGFVEREKYKGVELTHEGRMVALEVLRHHRLLETFLTNQLDYDWSEVHDEADRLEHHISEEFERRIAEELEEPDIDPHGAPIPSADLAIDAQDTSKLAEFDEGDNVVVKRVKSLNREQLRYLSERGLTPGTRVEIDEIDPFGMITVEYGDDERNLSLPREISEAILVNRADENGKQDSEIQREN